MEHTRSSDQAKSPYSTSDATNHSADSFQPMFRGIAVGAALLGGLTLAAAVFQWGLKHGSWG